MENNDVMFGDKSLDEWTNMYQQSNTLSDEQAEQMGILQPLPPEEQQEQQPSDNKLYATADKLGIEHPDENKEYKQLSVGDTFKDIGKTMGAEALKIVAPKKDGFIGKLTNNAWTEEDIYQHEAETRIGEASKYLYRYGAGTLSFIFGGGKVGAAIKGVGLAAKSTKAIKLGAGIEKLFGAAAVIKTGENASKLAKAGAFLGNGALTGAGSGALADLTLYRQEEEGHLADAFGVTDNPILSYLQTDENDSELEGRLKNVVEGFIIGIPFGIGVDGLKATAKYFKSMRKAAVAQTAEEAANALPEAIQAETNLKNVLATSELVDAVKKIKSTADVNGLDAEQLIIDTMNPKNYDDAKSMLKMLDDGEDIFVHEDGTFDISIQKWEDASKVSPEEYKRQLAARDTDIDNIDAVREGDTAISDMDAAVKDSWTNRGWIGENEELTSKTANKVAKNYTDKWEIDNNIKVEFIDGLTINGKSVEGNTSATKYKGKVTKSKQNAIDKKKLQIAKLEDKITMEEGTNAPVRDVLDNLKEELRIAQNELEELTKEANKKNRISDITIQIDKNAKNPYATLRSELEHARDLAKGEVPNQNVQHFSRYKGMNEAEVAPDYVYKKSQKKLGTQNFMNPLKNDEDMLQSNQKESINGQRTNDNIQSWNGNRAETSGNGMYGARPSESNEGIRPYIRRSESSSSNTGSIIHDPSPEFKAELEANGKPVNSYKELAANSDEDAASFISNFRTANEFNGKKAAQVYEYSAEEYKQMKLFTAENGKSGFAIKTDGDIVSVFSSETGSLAGMMNLAIQNGGKKLDCFDTFLPKIYKKFGFVEVDRVKWNEEYAPKNWDKDFFKKYNNGEPDVVYMELKSEPLEGSGSPMKNEIGNNIPNENLTGLKNDLNSSNDIVQLKLDFDSVEDATSKLANGEIAPKTMGDIDKIVTKAAEIDPLVSGHDWKALAEDTDKLTNDIKDLLELSDSFDIKTLWSEDGDSLRKISRKQLETVNIISQLKDKMDALGKDIPIATKKQYVDTINSLIKYVEDIGSAKGEGLNEQKFLNKAIESFGSARMSKTNKEGIRSFVDLLKEKVDEINLQFTRGSLLQKKQALYSKLAELDPVLASYITTDAKLGTYFDKVMDDILKNPDMDMNKIYQGLEDIFTEQEYTAFLDAGKLAPDKQGWFKTLVNWTNAQGGLASYYVHNLLSGVGSLVKNVVSGGMNTIYFPARKILAGITDPYLSTDQKGVLLREGFNTYKNLITTWNESWQLCCQAFLKGEGKLSSIGEDTLNLDPEVFKGFHELGVDGGGGIWETIQNIHSVMTRAMGASDELMSQMNYRSIARAKAMEQADKLAAMAGKINDEAWINNTTDELFKKYFTTDGKPLDVEIYNEAKSILYQNPLSGKMVDPTTGKFMNTRTGEIMENGETATQTLAMKFGTGLQNASNKNIFAKFFFPFVKTGTNILQMNLDHNIWYNLASPEQRNLLKSNTKEGALLRSQCAFGAFSFAMGSMLALNGIITGSMPSDAKERKALLALGWRPYSFKVGNSYVSYQGYEPLHTMLGFSADVMNLMTSVNTQEDEDRALKFCMQTASTFVNNFLDKAAFRSGLKSLSALFELDERHIADWKQAMTQPVQGLLPNVSMVKNISSVGTREAKSPQTISEAIFNMYFNRGLGEYRRDMFGDKQNITNMIITTATNSGTEPEYAELYKLAEKGWKPSEIGKVISGYNLKYSDFKDPETGRTAYDLMQDELSQSPLKEKVRDLVTSQAYQLLPEGINDNEAKAQGIKYTSSDNTKVNALNDLFIEYNDMAKEAVLQKYPNLLNKKGETLREASENADLIKMNKQLNNNMSDSAEKLKSLF